MAVQVRQGRRQRLLERLAASRNPVESWFGGEIRRFDQ
jgi:hypothetical protein